MFDLAAVQSALHDEKVDGWLLYDFRGLNVLARRIVGLAEDQMLSRRWFYFIPATGQPRSFATRSNRMHSITSAIARTYLLAGTGKPGVAECCGPSAWRWKAVPRISIPTFPASMPARSVVRART